MEIADLVWQLIIVDIALIQASAWKLPQALLQSLVTERVMFGMLVHAMLNVELIQVVEQSASMIQLAVDGVLATKCFKTLIIQHVSLPIPPTQVQSLYSVLAGIFQLLHVQLATKLLMVLATTAHLTALNVVGVLKEAFVLKETTCTPSIPLHVHQGININVECLLHQALAQLVQSQA
jgi:hypothetical protein